MGDMFVFMDLVMFAVGIYFIYVWYLLKYKGQVKEEVLLSKAYPYRRCKDKEGYKAYIGPRLLSIAVVCVVSGGINLVNDFTSIIGPFYLIFSLLFCVILIWFVLVIRKACKKFW